MSAFLNFITKCNSSDAKLIRFVIGHAVYCARVQPIVGRNYVLCCELTTDMVPRLKTNLCLVLNLRAVVTTFQWSCLLSTAVILLLLSN